MSRYFLSAGDASGEQHAGDLVRALAQADPDAVFLGLGGGAMEKAGAALVVHQREIAVGGLVEVLSDLGRIVGAWRRVNRSLREERPDLVILVDAPDFNIPLARRAKRLGIPVLYYISPQIWAWRQGRVRKIARRVDRMAVIFPFEVDFYAGTGLPVDFVGHPLVDRMAAFREAHPPARARAALGLGEGPLVALLPGSRRNEVRDTLPMQLEAARALADREPGTTFAVAVAPSISRAAVAGVLERTPVARDLDLRVFEGRTPEVLCAADVALAKPGTVTVEIALLGTPLVVAARVHPLTAAIMRRVVRVDSFTMPNLIAGRVVVPEFLQEEARPDAIARALQARLRGPARDEQLADLAFVRERLGKGGAAERTAEIAREMAGGAGAA